MAQQGKQSSRWEDFLDGKWISGKRLTWIVVIGIFIIVAAFILVPLMITQIYLGIDYSHTGEIGDTLGGIMGPIIAAIGAVLTFFAFLVQSHTNRRQWDAIQEQEKSSKREKFRQHFFELLSFLRENTAQIQVNNGRGHVFGNQALECLALEASAFVRLVSRSKEAGVIQFDPNISNIEQPVRILKFAYALAYYGRDFCESDNHPISYGISFRNESSSMNWYDAIPWYPSVSGEDQVMLGINFDELRKAEVASFPMIDALVESRKGLGKWHVMGIGAKAHLSSYFRILIRIAEFLEAKDDQKLEENDPDGYLRKLLRTQLSDEAQILIYYSSFSDLGERWWKYKYIQNLAVLKNVVWSQVPEAFRPSKLMASMINGKFIESEQDLRDALGIRPEEPIP